MGRLKSLLHAEMKTHDDGIDPPNLEDVGVMLWGESLRCARKFNAGGLSDCSRLWSCACRLNIIAFLQVQLLASRRLGLIDQRSIGDRNPSRVAKIG